MEIERTIANHILRVIKWKDPGVQPQCRKRSDAVLDVITEVSASNVDLEMRLGDTASRFTSSHRNATIS